MSDDHLQRSNRGIDDHLVAHRDPADPLSHRVDDARDITTRHVRQRRPRLPSRDPQVHVIQRARHDADPDVVRARLGSVDLAEAVLAG